MMANGNVEDEEEDKRMAKKGRSYSVDVKRRGEALTETVLPVVADSYRDIIKMVNNRSCILHLGFALFFFFFFFFGGGELVVVCF